MVINSMGWVEDLGYELLRHTITTLRADVVLVVGDDRLYSRLSAELRPQKGGVGRGRAGDADRGDACVAFGGMCGWVGWLAGGQVRWRL